ncbi:MAG TPA: PQQ-dependent sugar dehydrogenase [Thermoanaerobaculia bacterium]
MALVPVIRGLDSPVALTHAGDGSGRLFATLQEGRIVIIKDGAALETPFLDVASLVSCCGERGLLSVAFHPQFEANGFFFVNYTNRSGDTVVARYRVSATNRDVADPASASMILTIDQPFSNHNGGQLKFGPDGYLYIGMGDGGSGGDPQNRAQNLSNLLGKLLRIDVDRGSPYAIPADNPFVANAAARKEIWSYGLRNPWRFTFDRSTGDLYIADVGQNQWEEIHFQPALSRGGENYGWRIMEGAHCFNPSTNCNRTGLVLPIAEYDHSLGCSVTGGYVYRGTKWPQFDGVYFYADYCSGRIWATARRTDGTWETTQLLDTAAMISTFGEDERGEVYVVDHASGTVFRIAGTSGARRRGARPE